MNLESTSINQKIGIKILRTFNIREKDQVLEEKNVAIIDYSVDKPIPQKNITIQPPNEWYNIREGLKYQNEAERQRATAEVYRYLTPRW